MRVTSEQTTTNQWLTTAVTTLVIVTAVILFGLVISRMGLLNRLGSGQTAVDPRAITITTASMRFEPETLRVKAGQEVTLLLENEDLYGHSFDVDAFDLHVEMSANSRSEQTFTFTEAGTYTIYCAVPGHREAGMVSTLVVEGE